MKQKAWILATGIAVIVVVVALLLKQQRTNRSVTEPSRPGSVATVPPPSPSVEPVSPIEQTASEQPSAAATVSVGTESADGQKYVKITGPQVLATINNTPIMGKDLVPFGADVREQAVTATMYQFLLNLAIERELTFQAARAQAIELTEEQQNQLQQIRDSMGAHDERFIKRLDTAGSEEDQIALETRDAEGKLLLNSLLAKAGAPSPYVTEAHVEEYYRNHIDTYGALPVDTVDRDAAWQIIDLDIRQKLAPVVMAQYQEWARQYMQRLKAAANISLIAKADLQ